MEEEVVPEVVHLMRIGAEVVLEVEVGLLMLKVNEKAITKTIIILSVTTTVLTMSGMKWERAVVVVTITIDIQTM
jgi:hypothetical protein